MTYVLSMALSYPTHLIITHRVMDLLAESTNKNLMSILKKTVGDNKRSWDSKIKYVVWADRITKKNSTGKSPFELVYGLTATLPVSMQILIFRMLSEYGTEQEEME